MIIIFNRTNKGISISKEGEDFLGYARQVLEQAAILEDKYKGDNGGKKNLIMVIVNAPLRADLFREKAESLGLVYVSKVGMKLSFNAPNGDDKEKAAELKKLCKADPQLNTVYFQCTTA